MNRIYAYITLAIAALLLAGCSDSDSFAIAARIDGIGAQSITLTYTADGAIHRTVWQPDDKGVVKMQGHSNGYTLAELSLTQDGRSLAMIPVRDGERIELQFPLADPLQIKAEGSEAAAKMCKFISENAAAIKAGKTMVVNDAIARYVASHPADVVSTALLATQFDLETQAARADSLFNSIDPDARPLNIIQNFNVTLAGRSERSLTALVRQFSAVQASGDSLYTYRPRDHRYTLFVFTAQEAASGHDSIAAALARLMRERKAKRDYTIVELSLIADSTKWRRSLRSDSASWIRAWLPGSAANATAQRMQLTRTPYFIIADSAGRQTLRTPSVSKAAAFFK